MNDKDIKEIRKQLRGLVRELLPEVIESELHTFALSRIDKATKAVLERMEERQKDTLGFLVKTRLGR